MFKKIIQCDICRLMLYYMLKVLLYPQGIFKNCSNDSVAMFYDSNFLKYILLVVNLQYKYAENHMGKFSV